MSTIRCTRSLLRKLRLPSKLPDPGPSSAALGDWYATILYLRSGPLIVCASDRSLLPLVFPARKLDEIGRTLRLNLAGVLDAIGVPGPAIDNELSRMLPLALGNTANRSVLAVMNNFIYQLKGDTSIFPDLLPLELALRMAEATYGPIGYSTPIELTLRLLGVRPAFRVLPGGAT